MQALKIMGWTLLAILGIGVFWVMVLITFALLKDVTLLEELGLIGQFIKNLFIK